MMSRLRIIQKATPGTPELACIGCGYDLHSLDPHGDCPECGTPIPRTLGGNPLNEAQPQWLRRQLWAVRLISLTPPILMLLALLGVGMITQPSGRALLGVITGLCSIAAGGGLALLSMTEFNSRKTPPLQRPGPYVGGLIATLGALLAGASPLETDDAAWAAAVLAIAVVMVWVYALALLMPLARRAGSYELARQTSAFLIVAATVLGLPALVGVTIGIPMLGPTVSIVAVASSLIWVGAFVITCQWAAALLFRYVTVLSEVSEEQSTQ